MNRLVKGLVERTLPVPALRAVRCASRRLDRNDPLFHRDAETGSLAALYLSIRDIPGFFPYDDAVAFTLVLRTQTLSGIRGDILEIGSYHGRSTVVIAQSLAAQERLIVCDTFDTPTEDAYDEPATSAALRRTLARLAPDLDDSRLDIRASRSDELTLTSADLRFVHLDGGHSHDVALHDLRLAAEHLQPHGIIAVDDYAHPYWPGVTSAVDAFLSESEFRILADANRWAESGRKLYLGRA